MARMPRVVVSGYPHHVTQRGNRRQKTFFCTEDYQYYLELMSEYTRQSGTEVWAYCLMPNHVHLMVPGCEEWHWGLRHWGQSNIKCEWGARVNSRVNYLMLL